MSTSTRRRKAERQAQQKRQQQLTILIVVITVAVIAVALIAIASIPPEAPVQAAEASENYAGLERGVSENGYPQLGSPDAPVLITEYSSFGCGHCANFHDNQFMQLLDDVRAGRLQIVYVPVTNQFAAAASAAALCALDQGRFWEMHDLLYNWLRQYANSAYTLDRIMLGASALGLDLPTFEACLMGEEIFDRMNNANALFGELAQQYPGEVTGTPTISINGVPPVTSPGHRSGALPLDTLREAINAAQ